MGAKGKKKNEWWGKRKGKGTGKGERGEPYWHFSPPLRALLVSPHFTHKKNR